jgi:predicted short-subunit dehydrogenase-like oxidoreductase (DUF2520 family)
VAAARVRPSIAILGCGHVGSALALELLVPERPLPFRGKLCVWSRSGRSVQRLRRWVAVQAPERVQRLRVAASAREALAGAEVVLLCVADDALVPLAQELAGAREVFHGQVVLSTNGYLPLRTLAALRRRGCAIGRLHPLAPIPTGQEHLALIMATFALEGDARAVREARRIVRGIQGKALLLKGRGAAQTYHAGASLLGGGLVALFHLAERAMARSVSSRTDLREALEVFGETVLWNVGTLGPEKALTGALARGSESLVRGHLAALAEVPEADMLYRVLGQTMLELARARGSIDGGQERRLRAIIAARRQEKRHRRLTRPGRPRG